MEEMILNTTFSCNVYERIDYPLCCFLDEKICSKDIYISPFQSGIEDIIRGGIADSVSNKIYHRWRNQ